MCCMLPPFHVHQPSQRSYCCTMWPLKVSELTSLNPPVAGDAQIECRQMLMFGLGITNNPQPYSSTTTTTIHNTHPPSPLTMTTYNCHWPPPCPNTTRMMRKCHVTNHSKKTGIFHIDTTQRWQWWCRMTPTQPPLSISLFTWNPGAMLLIAMWQPNNEQWLMSLFIVIGWTPHDDGRLNNNNAMATQDDNGTHDDTNKMTPRTTMTPPCTNSNNGPPLVSQHSPSPTPIPLLTHTVQVPHSWSQEGRRRQEWVVNLGSTPISEKWAVTRYSAGVIQDWKVMPRGHSQTVVYS